MSRSTDSEHTSAERASVKRTVALADFHRALGARWSPYRGVEAAAAYGDEAAELAALQEGCGLVERSWLERIEMRGEDRARFLNGLVTCDVTSLEAGQGTYGFVTNVKGRILADAVVLALEDRLCIELSPGTAMEVGEHLRKYVIVDRVEIGPREGEVALSLIGPRSTAVLAGAFPETVTRPDTAYGHLETSVHGAEVHLVREPSLGETAAGTIDAWTLWTPTSAARTLCEALIDRGAEFSLKPVGHRALDRLRVAAGRPLYGLDFDAANFPQETGLEDEAVSYTKGCYLGQEVVARIHYRGGVNRHLRKLVFSETSTVTAAAGDLVGRSLRVDGREVGRVTSVAETDAAGRIGLAILHQRAEPEAEVEIDGGGKARVVAQ